MVNSRKALLACATALTLSGCAWFPQKDLPLDISENLPEVREVIRAVQVAIDGTSDNENWSGSQDFKDAAKKCKNESLAVETACPDVQRKAYADCRNETGAGAGALCSDLLRLAAEACAVPPDTPACKYVGLMAPPKIKSAKLQFSAMTSREVSVGASLKLLSAEMARKSGRGNSYEIELIPVPKIPRESLAIVMKEAPRDQAYVELSAALDKFAASSPDNSKPLLARAQVSSDYQSLTDAINASLNAAYPACFSQKSKACDSSKVPQLALKSATYSMQITYVAKKGGGFEWSISPLSIVGGKFGSSKEHELVNVLTVVMAR